MAHVKSDVRLVIAGSPEAPDYTARLHELISDLDLTDRVELKLEWVPQEEMDHLLAGSRAVLYIPVDEDSYGYPSLEAAAHARPIITVRDSGGALEFVEDGVSGVVTDPTPLGLGRAFDRVFVDDEACARMGAGAAARAADLGISWDHVVSRLLGSRQ
jgi:glycosyltransferase involved in cell wall biosynthesis